MESASHSFYKAIETVAWRLQSTAPLRFPAAVVFVLSLMAGCKHDTKSYTLHPQNVIVVTIDTLRADHVGCYGYSRAETPNLDRLAASGGLF